MTDSILPPDASPAPGPQYESGGRLYQRLAAQETPTEVPTEYAGFPRLLQWQIGRQLPSGPVQVEVLESAPQEILKPGAKEPTIVYVGASVLARWTIPPDLVADPDCLFNLWNEPKAAERQSKLLHLLIRLMAENVDPLPTRDGPW